MGMGDTLVTQLSCAFGAGIVASVVGSPVCVLKTRIMNLNAGESSLKMIQNMVSNEGLGAFYKGYSASLLRLVSWNAILLVTLEQIKNLFA